MDPFYGSLTNDQRISFASAFFSTLSLDQLIHIRDTIIKAHIVVKGGHDVPSLPLRAARKIRQKIKLTKLNVNKDDTYDTIRTNIINVMGDAVSTKIFVNIKDRHATITFDNYDVAETAFERLEQNFPVVVML